MIHDHYYYTYRLKGLIELQLQKFCRSVSQFSLLHSLQKQVTVHEKNTNIHLNYVCTSKNVPHEQYQLKNSSFVNSENQTTLRYSATLMLSRET